MDLVSTHPFWLLKNGLLHEYSSLQEDACWEVLVLGAGISGALIAHALVKAGRDVLVIDKRDVAGGSTSASTALLQYEIDTHLAASPTVSSPRRSFATHWPDAGTLMLICSVSTAKYQASS